MGRIVICILSNLFCLTYVQRNNNLIFKVSDDCNCKSFLTVQEHFIRAFFIVLRAFLQHLIWLQVISVIGNVLQKWHIWSRSQEFQSCFIFYFMSQIVGYVSSPRKEIKVTWTRLYLEFRHKSVNFSKDMAPLSDGDVSILLELLAFTFVLQKWQTNNLKCIEFITKRYFNCQSQRQ